MDRLLEGLDFGKFKSEAKPIGYLHDIYLCGEILSSENYIDYFETIRNASESDIIRIHINSPGGDMFSAIQFIRTIQESRAQVIASAEGCCMSAATMIFLTADMFEISDHCLFMFHNYAGGAFGKGGEMYDQIVNERKWSEKIIHKVYHDFLTNDEIKSILDNKDIWMEGEDVKIRLEKKIENMKLLQGIDIEFNSDEDDAYEVKEKPKRTRKKGNDNERHSS